MYILSNPIKYYAVKILLTYNNNNNITKNTKVYKICFRKAKIKKKIKKKM